MEGNENTEDTVGVIPVDLNGQSYVQNIEDDEQTLENKSPKRDVEGDVQAESLHADIHLHSLPNMGVHILHGSPHISHTEGVNSNNLENHPTVCVVSDTTCTPTVLLSETISMSSASINAIPHTVVLTTPVLSSLCPTKPGNIEDVNGDAEQQESLLMSKSEGEEMLIPKSEQTQELDDTYIGLTASGKGITNSVNDKLNTTTGAEGIVVTAHQTSMCYLRQIFDHDQVTSQGQMPTLAHGVTSHDLPELQQCKWQGCCQHFLSLEDLVHHVNEYHIRTDKNAEFCCHWHGCSRNGKGFNARYKMLIHMRTHTGEKPHKCRHEDCGKSFSRLENLKIHQRSHTGERPYICPIEGCDKRYSNSSDRFKHTRTHYERKPYHCRVEGCEKCYTDPSSLRKHLKTHHGQDVNIEEHE